VRIAELEQLTGLDFGPLSAHDAKPGPGVARARRRPADRRPGRDPVLAGLDPILNPQGLRQVIPHLSSRAADILSGIWLGSVERWPDVRTGAHRRRGARRLPPRCLPRRRGHPWRNPGTAGQQFIVTPGNLGFVAANNTGSPTPPSRTSRRRSAARRAGRSSHASSSRATRWT
jgi:hypothetical protein